MLKRHQNDMEGEDAASMAKKFRSSNENTLTVANEETAVISASFATSTKSSLNSSNILLTGHEGPVYSLCFEQSRGKSLASACQDGTIFLWDISGEAKNYNVLAGHKNAVLEVKWPTEIAIISCSADKTVALWDAYKGSRVRRFSEHSAIVNCCAAASRAPHILASGSDDNSAILWDSRNKRSVCTLSHEYQVLGLCLSAEGSELYTGGIDSIIRRWDLRNEAEPVETLCLGGSEGHGHTDSVTGLALSPDGHHLLATAMDSSLLSWDVRPFAAGGVGSSRREASFEGAIHSAAEKNLLRCAWSPDQEKVTCGSSDRVVKVWEFSTGKLLYYLPGHKGSVNDVVFHPFENVIASAGTDKQIFLGELS